MRNKLLDFYFRFRRPICVFLVTNPVLYCLFWTLIQLLTANQRLPGKCAIFMFWFVLVFTPALILLFLLTGVWGIWEGKRISKRQETNQKLSMWEKVVIVLNVFFAPLSGVIVAMFFYGLFLLPLGNGILQMLGFQYRFPG